MNKKLRRESAHSCPSTMILKRLLSSAIQIILKPKSPLLTQLEYLVFINRQTESGIGSTVKVGLRTRYCSEISNIIIVEKTCTLAPQNLN